MASLILRELTANRIALKYLMKYFQERFVNKNIIFSLKAFQNSNKYNTPDQKLLRKNKIPVHIFFAKI